MKKILVGAAVLASLTAVAPTAQAQQAGGVVFGISGGLNVPIGDLGDSQGSGFGLMGHITGRPGSFPLAIRGDVGFLTNPGKTITPIGGGQSFSTEGVTWTTANANVIYNFEGAKDATFVPYIIGGGGIYNGSEGIGTKLGLSAGGGVTFKLSGFDAFTEARFTNIFTDGSSARMIPIMFGVNFKP
ncbi:MAG: hypothetical protein V4813_13810 [Gemmatimonadota bacterium]